ncbi:hypothetical protein [Salinispora arenicola]|uniref:hypothetical protein n=1 Tax=Salinispora arenicola TaxID=168697 RepID=UPI0027DBBDB0|nr:hypothetical protein [Salinispora arenicola]
METKRRDPGDDLTTVIIKAGEDEQTPAHRRRGHCALHLLIGGGTETTANVLCHTVVDMLTHPDQLAMVRSGAVSWESAWEEEVRKDGAVGLDAVPLRDRRRRVGRV